MAEAYHLNALPPGTMLQEYEVLRVLGEGSFGIVYLTKGKYLDDLVAIKEYLPSELATRVDGTTVTPTSSGNEEFFLWGRQKFLEEARMLSQLANPRPHPNIVAIRRFFELNGTAYLVMDYEQGEALSDLLGREKHLPETRVLALMEALLDGLETVHAAGIIHRDIKPSNIFLRTDGSPVLLDFGAARLALGEKTQSTFNAMSPAYAAAEQIMSSDKIGPWTDMYGLGATLYRAVTGRLPQPALERLMEDDHLTAAEVAGDSYGPALLKVIDAALALKADDRPQSVAQWRALLQAPAGGFSGEETVIQTFPEGGASTSRRQKGEPEPTGARPLLQGKRTFVAATVLGVLVLAVGATFASYYLPREEGGNDLRAGQNSAEAERKAAEEVHSLAEAEAELKAAEEARRLAEAEAERKAAEEARRLAEAEAELKAAEEALRLAEAEAEREAAEEARRLAEAEAEREATEKARRLAAAEAKRKAEEEAWRRSAVAGKPGPAEKPEDRQEAALPDQTDAEIERQQIADLEAHVAANEEEVARELLRFWRKRQARQFNRGQILEWRTLRSDGTDFLARVEFYLDFRAASPYSHWDTKTFRVRRTKNAVEFLSLVQDEG